MTDKLRKTQPLKVSFSDGEQPTAAKLAVMATQTRQGSAIIERAIGDLWNQSGDSVMIDFPLQIPNLARLLGENQYLNPAMYPMFEDFTYYEDIGAAYAGRTEGYLKFRPKTNAIASQSGGSQFTTIVASEYLVGDPVDSGVVSGYWLDTDTGRFRIDSPLAGTEVISYVVDPTVYEDSDDILPGIIPDPRQGDFTGVKVTQDGSGRDLIVLPPRRPLTWDTLASTVDDSKARPSHYPSDDDIALSQNYETVSGVSTPRKYWNSSTVATEDEHYRYHLPKEILDAYSSMSAGDEYPNGAMYLWDTVTQTIIEGVIFKKPTDGTITDRWVIEIDTTASSFTFPTPTALASEVENDYTSTGLVLITCGSPVARNVFNILARQLTHSHNGGDQTNKVPHKSLDGLNPPDYSYAAHSARYPTNLPRWSPSRWELDDHTSLLSRAGSYGDSNARRRDPNDNAMLGDLVLANSIADSDNVFLNADCPDDSFSIYFGSTSGNKIYGTVSGIVSEAYSGSDNNGLEGIADGSGHGLKGLSGDTGYGVYGEGSASGAGGVYGEGHTDGTGGRFVTEGGFGVHGSCTSGRGIYGYATTGIGVYGLSTSSHGVYGISDSGYGTYGQSDSGEGVYGFSSSSYGVYGKTNNVAGYSIFGEGGASGAGGVRGDGHTAGPGGYFTSTSGYGVYSESAGIALYSKSTASIGIKGEATLDHGVYGITNDASSYGVVGYSTVGHGLLGQTTVASKYGVEAIATTGRALNATATSGFAVYGVSSSGVGIYGNGTSGVYGQTVSGEGVFGEADAAGTGIYGASTSGYGGSFTGNSSGGASGKAALHIGPQSAEPSSSPLRGDLYVNTTDGLLNIHNNNQWVRMGGVVHRSIVTRQRTSTGEFPGESYSIPANTLRIGSIIKIRIQAKISSFTSGNWRVDLYRNGVAYINTLLTAANLDDTAKLDIMGIVRSTGSSGEIMWVKDSFIGNSSTNIPHTDSLSDTVNTTAAITLSSGVFMGTMTADLTAFVVELY